MRGSGQLVEKVGFELVATTNQARNPPKSAYLVPALGFKQAQREFFQQAVVFLEVS